MTDQPSDPPASASTALPGRPPGGRSWIVIRAGRGRGWGGDIRRARIFERLAARTSATVIDGWGSFRNELPDRPRLWRLRGAGWRPYVAASEGAPPEWFDWLPTRVQPLAVSIYDDQIAQTRALGVDLPPEREAELLARRRRNEAGFRWHVVPTAAFAEAFGYDADRIVVGGQGTVTAHVRPGPWPERPAVGMVSGSAPGRGIEALIDAVRQVRAVVPDTQLYLWLVATSDASAEYIEELRAQTRDDAWIVIEPAPYEQLGPTLAKATVLVIPHPAIEYMDVILPVKLFDSLAAGRPLVVTPRRETVKIVEPNGVGLVSADDAPASLAEPIARLLADDGLARRMGAAARDLAEREYDWDVLGDRIADELFRREGLTPGA
ncbi:MAG: glycosyltransferase family 4 protein [Chloroflexota bacterium]